MLSGSRDPRLGRKPARQLLLPAKPGWPFALFLGDSSVSLHGVPFHLCQFEGASGLCHENALPGIMRCWGHNARRIRALGKAAPCVFGIVVTGEGREAYSCPSQRHLWPMKACALWALGLCPFWAWPEKLTLPWPQGKVILEALLCITASRGRQV